LGGSLALCAVSVALFYVTFFVDDCFILLGGIPYLLIVTQIVLLVLPSAFYCWRNLMLNYSTEPVRMEGLIVQISTKFLPMVEEMLMQYRNRTSTREVQTYESALLGFGARDVQGFEESSSSSRGAAAVHDPEKDEEEWNVTKEIREEQKKQLFSSLMTYGMEVFTIFSAETYLPLFEYTRLIGQNRLIRPRKAVMLWCAVLGNLWLFGADLYRMAHSPSGYFVVPLVIRVLFFPAISFFHVGISLVERPPKWVSMLRGCAAFSICAVFANVIAFIYLKYGPQLTRINSLRPVDYTEFAMGSNYSFQYPICTAEFLGLSVFEVLGLAFGPYDVVRNETTFDIQMQYFFGPNWTNRVGYEVHYFDDADPFMVYRMLDTNTTVFGFRGFASGAEVALHAQYVILELIVPTLTDLVPFYELVVDLFMENLMAFMQRLAASFTSPTMLQTAFLERAKEIYEQEKGPESIFTGVNVGGLFAKALGMTYKTHGISFVSFPVLDDMLKVIFEVDELEDHAGYVTNIHTSKGWFTMPEPELANNYAIPWVPLGLSGSLAETASAIGRLKPTSSMRDSVYRTFCILEEMCGRSRQFGQYCSDVIGHDDLLYLRIALEENY
jgi:hypothetical protein